MPDNNGKVFVTRRRPWIKSKALCHVTSISQRDVHSCKRTRRLARETDNYRTILSKKFEYTCKIIFSRTVQLCTIALVVCTSTKGELDINKIFSHQTIFAFLTYRRDRVTRHLGKRRLVWPRGCSHPHADHLSRSLSPTESFQIDLFSFASAFTELARGFRVGRIRRFGWAIGSHGLAGRFVLIRKMVLLECRDWTR